MTVLKAGIKIPVQARTTLGKPAEFTLYCANAQNYEFALRIRGKVPITTSMLALP